MRWRRASRLLKTDMYILKILSRVVKIAAFFIVVVLFFLLIVYLAIQISPFFKFPYVKDRDLIKFKALTGLEGETLLIYRKKVPDGVCFNKWQTCICYTHFIKADGPFTTTQQTMTLDGYDLVPKSDCVAQTKNLHELKLSWAAPFYHYAGSREYLIYGSTENLNLTVLMNDKRQIWHKEDHIPWGQPIKYDHEVILYPEFNMIQINTLGHYSVR
jgi:hypothetical protein